MSLPFSAVKFDFPPPVKPEKIRLVLPEEDEPLDVQNEHSTEDDSTSSFPHRGIELNPNIVSRFSELNKFEIELMEREEAVKQTEARLAERERSLWEFEALLLAQKKLLSAQQKQSEKRKTTSSEACEEDIQALHRLQAEITQQKESLELTQKELNERAKFVEASEERLFEKTMAQQEEESRMEQMKEDLDARELRINQMEGKPPPPKVQKEIL